MSCGLPQNTADLSLSEVARVAISLVCLDPRFENAAREIGTVLGSRLASPLGVDPLSLPVALARLREACREAGFVECEVLRHARDEAHIRLQGCTRILAGHIPIVGRCVCDFDVGFFEGFLRHLAHDPSLTVTEMACLGRGDPFCEFCVRRNDTGV